MHAYEYVRKALQVKHLWSLKVSAHMALYLCKYRQLVGKQVERKGC